MTGARAALEQHHQLGRPRARRSCKEEVVAFLWHRLRHPLVCVVPRLRRLRQPLQCVVCHRRHLQLVEILAAASLLQLLVAAFWSQAALAEHHRGQVRRFCRLLVTQRHRATSRTEPTRQDQSSPADRSCRFFRQPPKDLQRQKLSQRWCRPWPRLSRAYLHRSSCRNFSHLPSLHRSQCQILQIHRQW